MNPLLTPFLAVTPFLAGVFAEEGIMKALDLFDRSGETHNEGREHRFHSAKFRSSIQKRWKYWKKALEQLGLQ